jgi:hypothetical protein
LLPMLPEGAVRIDVTPAPALRCNDGSLGNTLWDPEAAAGGTNEGRRLTFGGLC